MSCVNEDDFDLVWEIFPKCNKCNSNLRVVSWNKKKELPKFIERNNFLLDNKKSSHIQKQKTLSDF